MSNQNDDTETVVTEAEPLSVHRTIAAVMRDVKAVGKDRSGPQQQGGFRYRGIDDIMAALHPLLARHQLVIIPDVVANDTGPPNAKGWVRSRIEVRYRIYGPAGDSVEGSAVADALDNQDKAFGKAMSYAYKSFVIQLFCIPTEDLIDNEQGVPMDYNTTPPVEPPKPLFVPDESPTHEHRAVEAKLQALPDDARLKLDRWWVQSYAPVACPGIVHPAPLLSDGAHRPFAVNSPVFKKIEEMVEKAVHATGTEPFGTDQTTEDEPPPKLTPAQQVVVDALNDIGEGTVGEIVDHLKSFGKLSDKADGTDEVRVTVETLHRAGVLELDKAHRSYMLTEPF